MAPGSSPDSASDGKRLGRPFNAEQLQGYFAELDEELSLGNPKATLRLLICGGAAVASLDQERFTHDVDVISDNMSATLVKCSERIAERHGLQTEWLNDSARVFTLDLPVEPERIFTGRVLEIDAAGPRYLLAMKLASGRDADAEDCRLLIRHLQIRAEGELRYLIERANPEPERVPVLLDGASMLLKEAWRD